MKWCVENGEGAFFLVSNRFHFSGGLRAQRCVFEGGFAASVW